MNTLQPFAQYLAKHQFVPAISHLPETAPRMIVVMPSYREPALLRSLESLYRCRRPLCFTEVIVVINHPEHAPGDAKRQNEESLHDARQWAMQHNDRRLQFHVIYKPDVAEKSAGVGYARKTGMDEAVYRFLQSGVEDGVISGFDADSACDENYLEEIERTFFGGKPVNGASIYYEHPLEGNEYDASVYDGAVLYELHLRYLNLALRYTGFPYACHTVGSSFAVRASAYVKQGGMNKRKAGEDFHFLRKIIPLGDYVEINTTRVIPSPRQSDRVPFGTGASIRRWMDSGQSALLTYPLEPFEDLKQLFAVAPLFFKAGTADIAGLCSSLSPPLRDYLLQNSYMEHIAQANANSASREAFAKRFFGWFDGLKTVKYLNDSCRQVYGKQPPETAAARLLQELGYESDCTAREILHAYRNIERR
ncbi:MAG: glycosyltransferase family 2 protein [Bacteroidales bacterium]|nr:glycosyltransferase family 2 protein [Bacteroidales bacterium]